MRIKKDDQIQIISGKDRGKRGKVLRTLPKDGKIVVEGMNLVKRHRRPRKGGEKGQRVEVPSPLPVCRVMIICSHCGKPTRIGYKLAGDSKARICKKCGSEI